MQNYSGHAAAASTTNQVYTGDADAPPKRQARVPAALDQLHAEQAFSEKLLAELEQKLRPALAPSRPQADGPGVEASEGPLVEIEGVVLGAAFKQYSFNVFLKDLIQRLEI